MPPKRFYRKKAKTDDDPLKAMMASLNAAVDKIQGGTEKAVAKRVVSKPRVSAALLAMAAFVKLVVLTIDVGLRKPGLAVLEIWWDPDHERPCVHIRYVTADSVVPDGVRNVKSLKTERNIDLLKQYIHKKHADLLPPDLTHIFIERQHSKGSRVICTMAYVLYAWLPEAYAKYNTDNTPKCLMVSAKLKTQHFSKKETNTRPKRKRIVYKDMETYIPSQGAEMAALFARQIKGDTAKFDMCDAVAQAVAWFTYNVKRPDGRAPPPRPPDSDSEFSDEDVDDTLPRVKAVAPSDPSPFTFNSAGYIV